jgi:hypothetical protein
MIVGFGFLFGAWALHRLKAKPIPSQNIWLPVNNWRRVAKEDFVHNMQNTILNSKKFDRRNRINMRANIFWPFSNLPIENQWCRWIMTILINVSTIQLV